MRANDVPTYWDFNLVRVEGPDAGLEPADLVAKADAALAGLAHRKLEIEDEATGERLRPGFDELGWVTERMVWMRHAGPVPPGPDAERADAATIRPLREEWLRSEGPPVFPDEASVQSFLAVEERVDDRIPHEALVTRDHEGAPSGYVTFTRRGAGGEVLNAYVTPAHRGKGLGAGLVVAAVAAMRDDGAEDVFILADDEDRPKHLYARLGFQPVWIQHAFTRTPDP